VVTPIFLFLNTNTCLNLNSFFLYDSDEGNMKNAVFQQIFYCVLEMIQNWVWALKQMVAHSPSNGVIFNHLEETFLWDDILHSRLHITFRVSNNNAMYELPSVLWHCWLGVRKSILPVKKWVVRCWCGCLSGARCRLFAYGPDDATAIPKPHNLMRSLNTDWFYLSGYWLPRLSWKRGC